MNRTALSVVALAVGAVLILGLYNIYKPQTNSMVHDVFNKVHITRMASDGINPDHPAKPKMLINLSSGTNPSTEMTQQDHIPINSNYEAFLNYTWKWHKSNDKPGYVGYWKLTKENNDTLGYTANPKYANNGGSIYDQPTVYHENSQGQLDGGSNRATSL